MRKRILPIEFLDVPKPHKICGLRKKGMLIIMDDKNLMEDILLLEKGVCDLYMHGTLESPHVQCAPGIQHRFKRFLVHAGYPL